MSDTLRFISFTPEAFGGINDANAKDMVISFPEANDRIIELEGDQGRCKTSLLNFVKVMCGGELPPNATNSIQNDLRGTSEFQIGDRTYKVRMTKGTFTLSYTSPTEKGKIESPKANLQQLIGNIGLSPMMLKDMKGKQQIEWLREAFRLTPEQKALENTIRQNYAKAFEARTDVNREFNRLQKEVAATAYYDYDYNNCVFNTNQMYETDYNTVLNNTYDDATIQAKYDEAQRKVAQYGNATIRLDTHRDTLLTQQRRIADLEKQLEEAKDAESKTQQAIRDGEAWFAANANPKKELDDVVETMKNSGEVRSKRDAIAAAFAKYHEYNAYEEKKIILEGQVAEYREQLNEFVKETTPDIPGLEVIVGDWHPDKNEGIYYNDRTPQQLSESEAWALYLLLCKGLGIKVVLLENVTSMGSAAIDVINEFVRDGGYVFCTKMNRQQKNINISFHHNYE
jgi:nucleoside diphosphate kinase